MNATEPGGAGYVIPFERAPASDQRAFLRNRLVEIEGYLRRATDAEILAEIGPITLLMAAPEASVEQEVSISQGYLAILRGVPLAALRRACRAFLSGERGDGHWAPRPGELLQAAKGYAKTAEEDFARIKRIDSAQVQPPRNDTRRGEALAHVAETLRILRASSDPHVRREPYRLPTMQEAEVNLQRLAVDVRPIKLSPLARASLGLGNGQQFEEQMDG